MKPRGHTSMTLVVAMLFATAGLSTGMADAQPVPGTKTMRPAATGPSPEENRQKQLPPPAKPEELRAPTQADMETYCLQNPKCRAKLEQAKQGKRPATPLPAATGPSPEEKLQISLPPPAQGLPSMGPRSHIPGPVERFFSWLNPFTPDSAWAQTKTQTPLSLTLTPANRTSLSPSGFIGLYGGVISGASSECRLDNRYSTNYSPWTENKPYVLLVLDLPAAGYYLIDMVASPNLAKLRHHDDGPILETWDFRAGCGGPFPCHYVTVDYYAAGRQTWYFWADPTVWGAFFYSVTIKSYP